MIGWPKVGWRGRLSLTSWILGTITLVFLAYQWLPIFTLGLLSFSGPTGGTTFPMNGASFHWYEELWRARIDRMHQLIAETADIVDTVETKESKR